MADANGNGKISKSEFFFWTLNIASAYSGMGTVVSQQLRAKDSSSDGKFNAREWAEAAEEFGFGSIANELFSELDSDNSGLVSFQEIGQRLKSRTAYNE